VLQLQILRSRFIFVFLSFLSHLTNTDYYCRVYARARLSVDGYFVGRGERRSACKNLHGNRKQERAVGPRSRRTNNVKTILNRLINTLFCEGVE
jgi:hypothetical protein